MLYLMGILFVAFLAATGVASCEHKQVISLSADIEANKKAAKLLLDGILAKNAAQEKADKERAITNQRDYDEKLKSLDAVNRKYAGQLRDPGRRNRSDCPSSQARTTPGTVAEFSVGGELSPEAGKFLRSEADRADKVVLWAQLCSKQLIPQPALAEPRPSLTKRFSEMWAK